MRTRISITVYVATALIILFAVSQATADEQVTKSFPKKDRIVIETVSGNCLIMKGESDKIDVEVVYDYDPEDSYEPRMKESTSTLRLSEKMYESNSGSSSWTVTVPDDVDVDFSSASGSFTVQDLKGEFSVSTASGDVELDNCSGQFKLSSASGHVFLINCQGDFDVSSASGDVKAEDCEGRFELSSASGDVNVRKVTVSEESNFSSASGDAYVIVAATPQVDFEVSSASGSATLDYDGNPIKGQFEFRAKAHGGDIECPFAFDTEETIRRHGERYLVKTATKDTDTPQISIGTSSGRAELRK